MTKPQYSGPWQRIRRTILERDQHLCQINGPGCTTHATQVDHITPVAHGGQWWEPSNLRAACATCNNRRPDNRHKEKWRTARTRIILVAGPPCSGKNEYVEQHAGPRDLIIDYERIAGALHKTPGQHAHQGTMIARNALLKALEQGKLDARTCWLISSNPNAKQMFPHHRAITIDPGRDTCLTTATERNEPASIIRAITDWYTSTQPTANGTDADKSRTW